MNNQHLEEKVRQDVAKVRKDLNNLKSDRGSQMGRLETNISQVADDLTNLVENSVNQISQGFDRLSEDTRESAMETAAMLKKDVRRGLRQYNAKAQEVAGKVPGGLAKKAVKYPWVAISIALVLGLLVGVILKPPKLVVDEF